MNLYKITGVIRVIIISPTHHDYLNNSIGSFPSQPYSPIWILIINPGTQERVNPRLRQFIRDSPPRIRNDWQLGFANQEADSPGLTNEEFKKAMKKLQKEIYQPTYPKRRLGLRGIFRNRKNSSAIDNKVEDDDWKIEGNCCAICVEDFVLNERVLATPCNHTIMIALFHGKCPVCRFLLCERRDRVISLNNNSSNNHNRNLGGMMSEDGSGPELVSLIRTMEDALNWVELIAR